jgi:signal transduction histidine kinase
MAEVRSSAGAMVINSNYELVFPNRQEDFLKDIDEMEDIISSIKSNKISLNYKGNSEISTESKNYYISIVKINSLLKNEQLYLVLFIDISSQLVLAKSINTLLIFVICIAGILTVFTTIFLSEKISRPIKEISKFAQKIGRGDFSKSYFDFDDKELIELSKVMNQSADYLNKYDKEQKTFFQNVSHELRTPLMSIKGYAEAIKYDVMDKNKASDIILEESDRLKEMVEDLLYLSKVDNISKDYELISCDLREVLSNCVLRQNINAMNKGISFSYDFDEEAVVYIYDEKNLSRAFLNLIENAIRYAQNEIKLTCKYYEDNIILISVEDDGIGIDEKDMPYIFDRFYKGNKGNHGIGLSIVKSIINKHNGRIYAENTKQGAKFTIVFNKIKDLQL